MLNQNWKPLLLFCKFEQNNKIHNGTYARLLW